MKLNKWMIAGSVLLIGAGAAPWGVGYVTEQQWLEATQQANQAQPFIRLSTEQYDRGILSAEATGTLTLTDPDSGDTEQLPFRATVTHGITGSLMDFEPRDGWQPDGANWFPEGEPELTLESRLWGSATVALNMPVIEVIDAASGDTFRSRGGQIQLDVSNQGSQADVTMDWPETSLTTADADLLLEGIMLEQSLSRLVGDVWTGDGTLSVQTFSLQGTRDVPPMVLSGLDLHSVSEAVNDDRALDTSLTLDLADVNVAGTTFGPHRFSLFARGLDVAGWNRFSDIMTQMQALSLQNELEPAAAFEEQMRLTQAMSTAFQDLMAAGLSVGVSELNVGTPQGTVEGELSVSHPDLTEEERRDMLMILPNLTGRFDLSLPVALTEQYPALRMQVAPLVKQGLVVQEGERLVLRGSLNDMVLDVNGNQQPLPPLF